MTTLLYLLINSSVELAGDLLYYNWYIIDASAGDIDITLPPDYEGSTRIFYRVDASEHLVMFHPDGEDTIDGAIFKYMPAKSTSQLLKMGGNWFMPIVSYT